MKRQNWNRTRGELIVLAAMVITSAVAIAHPAPQGQYVNRDDMKIYAWDPISQQMTFVRNCGIECDYTSDSDMGRASTGSCTFVLGAWTDPNSIFAGYGGCVALRVATDHNPTDEGGYFTWRIANQQVNLLGDSYSIRQVRWEWFDSTTGASSYRYHPDTDPWCNDVPVMVCDTGPIEENKFVRPSYNYNLFCGQAHLYKNGGGYLGIAATCVSALD